MYNKHGRLIVDWLACHSMTSLACLLYLNRRCNRECKNDISIGFRGGFLSIGIDRAVSSHCCFTVMRPFATEKQKNQSEVRRRSKCNFVNNLIELFSSIIHFPLLCPSIQCSECLPVDGEIPIILSLYLSLSAPLLCIYNTNNSVC